MKLCQVQHTEAGFGGSNVGAVQMLNEESLPSVVVSKYVSVLWHVIPGHWLPFHSDSTSLSAILAMLQAL